ncbi:c-type heme family protein [Roseofilum casamattae]|uniref:DUF3365 domain-containing protein n=1 Tax=Roseofilum casamattae BLCC-M143 TaxID=3022442 RepID=A0ABT7BWZ0_9CYAN|nr:DUF3365 domain-containing protein [Roseofilum casamattae]MDJ1182798.1 DUF3365 domain-containing protein [Roseofilum casamattae BLCC-M143]
MLVTLISLIIIMAIGGWNLNQLQHDVLEQEAQNRTELVLHFTQASQDYVTESLRPSVEQLGEDMPLEAISGAFATRKIVELFNTQFPEYIYKPATINPTNLIDRANEFEETIIERFRKNKKLEKITGYTVIDDEERFYLASPVRVFSSCLRCHGNPDDAPRSIVQRYGRTNGFGWKVADIVGAITIYVPTADLRENFAATLNNLWGTFIILTLVVSTILYFWFGRLVGSRLEHISEVMSKTANNPNQKFRIRDRADDEIGIMARSFNHMSDSLYSLYTKLEDKVRDRTAKLTQAHDEIQVLNQQLKAENFRMSAELDILQKMQAMILPKPEELQGIKDLEIAGFMQPADEVGGDYYDALEIDGTVTIGIGDVTGHGLESGILSVMTQTAIRTLKESDRNDPIQLMEILNRTLYKNVQRMNADRDLTLSLLDYREGNLNIIGQHEEAIVVRATGDIERIDTIDLGIPIAFDEDISGFLDSISIYLEPGDGVVLYTDGITEAENTDEEPYGIERLCDAIGKHWQQNVDTIQQFVLDDFRRFIGNAVPIDDMTLVIVKRKLPA